MKSGLTGHTTSITQSLNVIENALVQFVTKSVQMMSCPRLCLCLNTHTSLLFSLHRCRLIQMKTRMLAINVSIPILKIACLVQF